MSFLPKISNSCHLQTLLVSFDSYGMLRTVVSWTVVPWGMPINVTKCRLSHREPKMATAWSIYLSHSDVLYLRCDRLVDRFLETFGQYFCHKSNNRRGAGERQLTELAAARGPGVSSDAPFATAE
jgi:hypothetical protein